MTRLCLDRPPLGEGFGLMLKAIADRADRLHLYRVSAAAFSAIFNLRYYQGLADALGGRDTFFAGVAERSAPAGGGA